MGTVVLSVEGGRGQVLMLKSAWVVRCEKKMVRIHCVLC